MRVTLLSTAFNGLTQRVWLDLRSAGHRVAVLTGATPQRVMAEVAAFDPDLVICPFLRERVPEQVWRRYRTIIIHPGPVGDRGPSSLDWAVTEDVDAWGVTAIQAGLPKIRGI